MKQQARNNLQDYLSFDVCPCQKPLIVCITANTMGNLSLSLLRNKKAAMGHSGLPTPSNILGSFHGKKLLCLYFSKQKTSFTNHTEHQSFSAITTWDQQPGQRHGLYLYQLLIHSNGNVALWMPTVLKAWCAVHHTSDLLLFHCFITTSPWRLGLVVKDYGVHVFPHCKCFPTEATWCQPEC